MKSDIKPGSIEEYFEKRIRELEKQLRIANSRPTFPVYSPSNIPDDIRAGEHWINANTGVLSYVVDIDGDIIIKEVTATDA